MRKVLVSNKISFGEKGYKYLVGYLYNDHKVDRLHIMLPKMSAYMKGYDGQTKWMYFLLEDDIKKEFDSYPVYNTELLRTKIKYHGDEVRKFLE